MSLREKQQTQLDTEAARHTGMDWQLRSHRYLLLQVWCVLLTLAMVVMAALLASIKPKPAEKNEALTLQPEVSPTANTIAAPLKATGSPLSHIEMKTYDRRSWVDVDGSQSCHSCFLTWQDNSILCKKDSLYLLYAQVAFSPPKNKTNSVVLMKYASRSQNGERVIDGINVAGGSVWVSRPIKLEKGDRVRINITGNFFTDISYWGAFELH